jgi:glycerol uptake facilitator-like aquaporin
VLVLLGDGVVTNALPKRSKAGLGLDGDQFGMGFAVMARVFTAIACGRADAHLNPAVTLGFAVSSGVTPPFPCPVFSSAVPSPAKSCVLGVFDRGRLHRTTDRPTLRPCTRG